MLMETIKNNGNVYVDLENGVVLKLEYDNSLQAYRGYWEEQNMFVGIWTKKTLIEIINGEITGVKVFV